MSTEIRDIETRYGPHVVTGGDGSVEIYTNRQTSAGEVITVTASLDRADFLAAVAKECDVIVVDRAELPGVVDRDGRTLMVEGISYPRGDGAPGYRKIALRALAVAEYLDAHPPVDRALVDDLATVAYKHLPKPVNFDRSEASKYIRALIASGRIEVKP